jgi:hypothetical protein
MGAPHGAFEWVVIRSRAGSVVGTGFGCPRCYRVLDPYGHDLDDGSRMELPHALRRLAANRTTGPALGSD